MLPRNHKALHPEDFPVSENLIKQSVTVTKYAKWTFHL